MKYDRETLIQKIDDEIVRRESADAANHEEALAKYNADVKEWLAGPDRLDLEMKMKAALKKIKAGKSVARNDLAVNGWARDFVQLCGPSEPVEPVDRCQPLRDLRDFLVLVTDEEVTTAGLRDSGFRNVGTYFGGY